MEVLNKKIHDMEQFKTAMSVSTIPLKEKSKHVPPAFLSLPGYHSSHGLTVRDRYESAMFEAS
jgi:hypothetical protein